MVANKLLQLVFKKINLIHSLGIPIEYTLEVLWTELLNQTIGIMFH